jgi:hypothetical protein
MFVLDLACVMDRRHSNDELKEAVAGQCRRRLHRQDKSRKNEGSNAINGFCRICHGLHICLPQQIVLYFKSRYFIVVLQNIFSFLSHAERNLTIREFISIEYFSYDSCSANIRLIHVPMFSCHTVSKGTPPLVNQGVYI